MQDKQVETPVRLQAPATIPHLMRAIAEIAGGLAVINQVAFDWPYQDSLKALMILAMETSEAMNGLFNREMDRERHYNNLDHISDILNDIQKLKILTAHHEDGLAAVERHLECIETKVGSLQHEVYAKPMPTTVKKKK